MAAVGIPDVLSLLFRVVSFVLLLSAAGTPIFCIVFWHLLPESLESIVRLGWRLAGAALVFVIGHQLLEGARMAGEMSGVVDPAMQGMALHSSTGAAFAVRAGGLMLIAAGLRWRQRGLELRWPEGRSSHYGAMSLLALLGTGLAIASFALAGHTAVSPHRPAAVALLVLHLLVVSFWIGALWPLYLASGAEQPRIAGRLIDAFSRIAAWWVPTIFLAGAGLATLLIPDLSIFKRPYGELLLTKVTGFALLLGLASANKWRFGPACAAGETRAFRRTVIAEYGLICVVLAITATMTMFYSPEKP